MRQTIARLSVCVATLGALWSVAVPSNGRAEPARAADAIHFKAHSAQQVKGEDRFEENVIERAWIPRETAIVICDMWNQHWCRSATRRCGELAAKMAPLLDRASERGVLHRPSRRFRASADSLVGSGRRFHTRRWGHRHALRVRG